jgi:GNAT superfamily N-acetyltransferase
LIYHPLTPERWHDFEELFGKNGAYGGCWCMWWRTTRREFEAQKGDGNRRALKALVDAGHVPGILGYDAGRAVAWCSVAPRETLASLERSRVLKRLDEKSVWSIVCFYVAKSHRGGGVMRGLIRAAVDHVARSGGTIVEAYPTVPRSRSVAPVSSYMGFPDAFADVGFVECARPSTAKCMMRYTISPRSAAPAR